MNKQIKVSIIVLLVLVTVGFAAISLTLNFTGNININGSYDNFANGVVFSKLQWIQLVQMMVQQHQ